MSIRDLSSKKSYWSQNIFFFLCDSHCKALFSVICYKNVVCILLGALGIELKHLCLEYMTPWLRNLVRFCKHNDDAKRQRVTAILDKLITMTINEKQMYPSIQAKIWGSLGQVSLSNNCEVFFVFFLVLLKEFDFVSLFHPKSFKHALQWQMPSNSITPLYISIVILPMSLETRKSAVTECTIFYIYRSQTCLMWCWIAS